MIGKLIVHLSYREVKVLLVISSHVKTSIITIYDRSLLYPLKRSESTFPKQGTLYRPNRLQNGLACLKQLLPPISMQLAKVCSKKKKKIPNNFQPFFYEPQTVF